jgi:hypothetical protein
MERKAGLEARNLSVGNAARRQLRRARMEPFPGADPGSASLPRTRGRRSERQVLAGLDSNQRR